MSATNCIVCGEPLGSPYEENHPTDAGNDGPHHPDCCNDLDGLDLLSVPAAAKCLDIEAAEVYRLINSGELPAYQHEHRVVLRSEDVATRQRARSG